MLNNLPKNLCYLRKKKGLTQEQLQPYLGFTRSTWSNYENGISDPSIDDLVKISSFFGVSVGEIVQEDLEAKAPPGQRLIFRRTRGQKKLYSVNDSVSVVQEVNSDYSNLWKEVKKLRTDVDALKGGTKKK